LIGSDFFVSTYFGWKNVYKKKARILILAFL